MALKKDSILKGTALLTGAGLVVKLLGAAYRIPLSRLIGAEGIGLYQMAYPIYLMFLSLSTAGLPIAISRITAEQSAKYGQSGIKQIFKAALVLLGLLGLGGTLAMFLLAQWLSKSVVADPRAVFAMWALAPAIFFMSLTAAFRGYFQGQQKMAPSAQSQIIEQTVRVGVSLILVILLLEKGVEQAAAGAAFGATAGGVAGFCFLWLTFLHQKKMETGWRKNSADNIFLIIRRLIRFTLPISLAVILMPLLQAIDSIIVPAKLQSIGYTVQQATSMLGVLGNSWAVLYVPMIVTAAISTNLVPAIAASKMVNQQRIPQNKIQEGIRMALFYLIPVSIMFFLFGNSIYRIIYGIPGVEILSWLAPAVIFLGLEQVSAGVLQGLGRPSIPLVNFVFGAIIKIVVTLLSTGLPGLNLAGAALGTVCGAGVTAILNLIKIKKFIAYKLTFLPLSLLSALIFIAGGWYLKQHLNLDYILELLLIGSIGFFIYLGTLWFGGGIDTNDLEMVKKYLAKRRPVHDCGNTT